MPRLPGPRDPVTAARIGMAIVRRPYSALLALRDRFGALSVVGYGPTRYVYMLGREENEFILSTGSSHFTWREALVRVGLDLVDGDTALVLSDGEDHRRRRRLVQPAFHLQRVNRYLDVILAELNSTIDTWSSGSVVDVWSEMRAAVRRSVSRALFGRELADAADALGRHLQPALDLLNRPLRSQLHVGPAWRRARGGRAAADELLDAEIERRRANPAPGEGRDVLDELLEARDTKGGRLSDGEVADQVRSLIAAGYDTTSATIGWATWALLAHPAAAEPVRVDIETVIGDRPLRPEDLPKLAALDRFVSEVLRLWGAAVVGTRHVATGFEFRGYEVPAGSLVMYSPYVTHRLPELWLHPLAFDPDRWLANDVAPPYAYVQFGGGYRRCIGFAMASLEIKAALVTIIQRTRLSLITGQRIEPAGLTAMYPRFGVQVAVESLIDRTVS
jgi:cytochrome P450